MSTNTIKELKTLTAQVKKVRAKAIAELRAMPLKRLAKLEPRLNRWGVNALCWKVKNFPSDLSLQRLLTLLERKKELKL